MAHRKRRNTCEGPSHQDLNESDAEKQNDEKKIGPGRQKGSKNSPLIICLICGGQRSKIDNNTFTTHKKTYSAFACKKCWDNLEDHNQCKPTETIPFCIFEDPRSDAGIGMLMLISILPDWI